MGYSTLRVLNIFKQFKAPQPNRVKNKNKKKKIHDAMMALDVNC
jgi:hypothetical protein